MRRKTMRVFLSSLCGVAVLTSLGVEGWADSEGDPGLVLVVHGGAGTIRKADLTPELEAQYRAKLEEGLLAGYRVLAANGTSLDAVETVVRIYEDSPLFNAGKGAVFTAEGANELDAAIMDGTSLTAGAVASVTTIKNPISAARAVMERTPHVMLVGRGAEVFAAANGLEMVEPGYFFTERRWDALERARQRQPDSTDSNGSVSPPDRRHFGTVGALALDRRGHLAAATSTGGLTNKRFGRVGDSPIIGAGTYANRLCAVSGTGEGEVFMRHTVARDICARVEFLAESVSTAAETVIHQVLPAGTAGAIVLDHQGSFAMPFNTEGMYRGHIRGDGRPMVAIYRD